MFEAASKTEKVSDRIIEQIRDAVLSGELKPGDRLASEKELIAQFEVSKATMREALRVLEAMGLVEMRKGTQGGVFVAEVDMKTTIHSMMNFLHFTSVNISDITMLRFMLEPPVAHLAATRITSEDIKRLRTMIESEGVDYAAALKRDIGFHRYLARMTDNPILILIMDFIDNILRDVKSQLGLSSNFHDRVQEFHRGILGCLAKGDSRGARRVIAADLLWVGNHLSDLSGSPRFDPTVLGYNEQGERLDGFEARESDPSLEAAGMKMSALLAQEGDPEILKRGIMFKQVGTGDLYMIVPSHGSHKEG